MSSVTEIEVAIQQLSPTEQARLREWLLRRPLPTAGAQPKTGAELAAVWPTRFHLTPQEADALAHDLEIDHHNQTAPKPVAWE